MGPGSRSRAIALLATGTLVVHQLRFMLAFGGDAHRRLAHEGHGYLAVVLPLVGVGLALVCAHFAVLLMRERGSGRAIPRGRFPTAWAASSATLLVAYATQEGVEGTLVAGHPAGVAGIFGSGGWIAIPLCVVVGVLVALVLRGANAALALVGARDRIHVRRAPARRRTFAAPDVAPRNPLARHLSGRAPPVPAIV
jgi:hypothetical protein